MYHTFHSFLEEIY